LRDARCPSIFDAWLKGASAEGGRRAASPLVAVTCGHPLSADGHSRSLAVLIVECTDAAAELVAGALENDHRRVCGLVAGGGHCEDDAALAEEGWNIVLGAGLEEFGVDYAQGYVIGHPAPIAGLLEECQPWPT
jgi:hypothetical protein